MMTHFLYRSQEIGPPDSQPACFASWPAYTIPRPRYRGVMKIALALNEGLFDVRAQLLFQRIAAKKHMYGQNPASSSSNTGPRSRNAMPSSVTAKSGGFLSYGAKSGAAGPNNAFMPTPRDAVHLCGKIIHSRIDLPCGDSWPN
jgi:hypothetical protein